jgi:hypothetical protein
MSRPMYPMTSDNLPSKVLTPNSASVVALVKTNRPQYQVGRRVGITFVVTNTGKTPLVYDFLDGKQYDFTIADASGRTIWTWSTGRLFSQGLINVTIQPGKTYTVHAVWNGEDSGNRPVMPGSYKLTGRLTPDNPPVVTGSPLVNPELDPNNMGVPTETPIESGEVREVDVYGPVSASATITIVPTR